MSALSSRLDADTESKATWQDLFVSGDSHLLDLKVYKGIRILKPAQFLELLEKER